MTDRIGTQVLIAVNKSATHHAVDDLPLEAPPIIDRKARVGVHAGTIRSPFALEIDDGEISLPTDGDRSLSLTTHHAGGVMAQDTGNAGQRHPTLVISLAEHHGEQCLKAGEAWRRFPDAAGFCRDLPVYVIGGDNVNPTGSECRPQRLSIACVPDRGAYLANVAALPVNRMREVVRAGLNGQVCPEPDLRESGFERCFASAVHQVYGSPRLTGERRYAMDCLSFDKGRPRIIPGDQASFTLGIRCHEAAA